MRTRTPRLRTKWDQLEASFNGHPKNLSEVGGLRRTTSKINDSRMPSTGLPPAPRLQGKIFATRHFLALPPMLLIGLLLLAISPVVNSIDVSSCPSEMAPKIKLTYFDIEGRGEPVRLALALSGVPFEDERIKFPEWGELKPKTPFGQLPVLTIDDGPLRAQSGALLRWVGTDLAPNLYPKDKILDVEEAIGLIDDFSTARAPALYVNMRPENFGHPEGWSKTEEGQATVKALRTKVVTDLLPKYAAYITALLEKNDNQFIASKDGPTIADCVAVPFLRSFTMGHIDHIPVDCLDAYPAIVAYIKRFCALPQIAGKYEKGLY